MPDTPWGITYIRVAGVWVAPDRVSDPPSPVGALLVDAGVLVDDNRRLRV